MGSAPSEWPPGCEGALCHLQAREAGKSLLSLSLSFPVCKMGMRNITQSKKEGKSGTCYSVDGPGDIMLREVSQAQKDKYCAIPLIRGPWSCQMDRNGEWNGGCQGLGLERMGVSVLWGQFM